VEDISVNKSVVIDDALKQHIADSTGVLDPALFQPKQIPVEKVAAFKDAEETFENTTQVPTTPEVSASTILKLGKPLEFDRNEKHSFNEWLKLTRFTPIVRDSEPTDNKEVPKETSERAKKFELIDRFISKNPKINPKEPANPKLNLAKAQDRKSTRLNSSHVKISYADFCLKKKRKKKQKAERQ